MLHLKIKYFLNNDGINYFAHWFDEVYKISSLQEGFLDLRYETDGITPIVYLDFESRDKLEKWIEKPQHDELSAKIERYFVKPLEVESF